MEFTGKMSRWAGHGNAEFRANIARAYAEKRPVRLVISKTEEIKHVEDGHDASLVDKEFFIRDEVIGSVIHLDGDDYVFQFRKA